MSITTADQKKAHRLIKSLTPKASSYKEYRYQADEFIFYFNQIKNQLSNENSEIYRLDLVSSIHFEKDYLIAFVNRKWLSRVAPFCDAVASSELLLLGRRAPPLIIVPGKSMSKKAAFKSIVEHEIVHVNQAIRRGMPNLDTCKMTSGHLFAELIDHTLAEYEAHFIQLVNDPRLLPSAEYSVNLNEWCHLRGFTSGIEKIVLRFADEPGSQREFKKLVKKIEADLSASFELAGLSKEIGSRYAGNLRRILTIATYNVKGLGPEN